MGTYNHKIVIIDKQFHYSVQFKKHLDKELVLLPIIKNRHLDNLCNAPQHHKTIYEAMCGI
jgi:hypothetical protein